MTDPGLVIAHFGRSWALESDDGRIALCEARRHCTPPCVGDRVMWQPTGPDHGIILEVLPRRTLLTRPGRGGKLRPVAANLDQVLIVIAPEPPYDLLLVDQYLVVCEHHHLQPVILLNKTDLVTPTEWSHIEADLAPYRNLYPLLSVSAKTGEGMEALHAILKGKTSMFAGQSGVGKSSLLKTLIPDKEIRIGALSSSTRRGRHTTTSAMLFHLKEGGDIIDTPGVSVFGLANIDPHRLADGYKEFRPFAEQCRFNDCRHAGDLGCRVKQAVDEGKISAARYRRYLKLLQKLPEIS